MFEIIRHFNVVANIRYSKIESKSQQNAIRHSNLKVVANIRYSKIESKSQPNLNINPLPSVVANIRYSKIESKSQLVPQVVYQALSCCKYKIFKDRKQITTCNNSCAAFFGLLQI